MDLKTLQSRYIETKGSDDFEKHAEFINLLLSSNEPEVIAFHYNLLRDRENRDLYLRLRAAFVKRGEAGERFLIARIQEEEDPALCADILTILGVMKSGAALPLARKALIREDPDLRHRGCYVLGWMGEMEDIDLLGDRLLHDPSPLVRKTAATAHSQFYERLPKAKNRLLKNLKQALETEQDQEVIGWIVATVQYILGKRFGLKEDIAENRLIGDIEKAKEKCLRVLNKLGL